ncbi:hypothetical protein [Sphingobium sp. HDIP04]|uniref:hypothetical protein n=1 Tax=Sphingobium sp. HDIP04 TaxID=428994 RepID=UPI0003876694|nr:hypothetical protein [Sphingobium sp. HDIP04]EQA97279.1 hypothetical protein L286_23425 [Sphingobium sp. HDIP04]
MADTPSAPPLPDGSVDFNALHDAARKGKDLDKALEQARFVRPELQADAPPAPAKED